MTVAPKGLVSDDQWPWASDRNPIYSVVRDRSQDLLQVCGGPELSASSSIGTDRASSQKLVASR